MEVQKISDYLGYLLASANRQMRSGIACSIAEEGVSEEHWRVLLILSDEQGHSMGELAEAVLMNHPALTKNIDKLVSRGLVQRAPDALDSRKVLIFISDLGLEVLARLKRRIDELHRSTDAALGPRKAAQLKRLLADLIDKTASY